MKTSVFTFGILVGALFSCSQPADYKNENSPTAQVVEFAAIQLKDSVTEEMLLKTSSRLQKEFLDKQDGFLKRELLKKSDREYVDLVYWSSQAHADKVVQNAMSSPVCFAFFQLMKEADPNHPEGGLSYYQIVGEYQE